MEANEDWETRREKLIKMLTVDNEILDLHSILKELEYPNKKVLINDIKSISKSLKSKGLILKFSPPSCIACGYVFRLKRNEYKIPSKCPKCKKERIDWPFIKIK